jgi:hypothetical protein
MTTRTSCRALFEGHLDNSTCTSGPHHYDPSGGTGPEAGNHGEYPY